MIPIKLYCGGNFEFQYKDFTPDKLESDYRTVILNGLNNILHQPKSGYVPLGPGVDYIGPFYFYDNGLDGEGVAMTEYKMVKSCTHTIFLVDNSIIPGTVSEIIHAALLKKDIAIFYVGRTQDEGEPEQNIGNMNWYPIEIAKNVADAKLFKCKDREEAKSLIYQYVNSLINK